MKTGRKYLQITNLTKDLYSDIKNSGNSIMRKTQSNKMGKTSEQTLYQKIYRRQINT